MTDQPLSKAVRRFDVTRRSFLKIGGLAGALSFVGTQPVAVAAVAERSPHGRPGGLLTSLMRQPLGVADPRPRLTWIVPTNVPDGAQVAYQVQVARDAEALARGAADVWDSGQVSSAQSVAVPYGGPELEPAASYAWRVRTWSTPGLASPWSDPQRIVTAVGDRWQAQPVWAPPAPRIELADGRLEIEATITEKSIGVFFRARNIDNAYMWQISAGTPARVKPHVRRNGGYTALKDVPVGVSLAPNTPFRLVIELDGPTIRTYIDDVLVDTTVDSTYSSGTVGFRNGSTESHRVHAVRFVDPAGVVRFQEDFSAGAGAFAGGTVNNGDLVVARGGQIIATLGENNDWALLRTEFDLPDTPVRAAFLYGAARSTAESRQYVYRAWVNGAFAGVGPARSVRTETRYQTHDVTALLRPGRNALAVLAWAAAGRTFAGQLVVELVDGTRQVVASSADWRARRAGAWRPAAGGLNTGYYNAPSEHIDARHEPVGWLEPDFDDAGWEPAAPAAALGELAPVPVEPMGLVEFEPTEAVELTPGVWRFDLGKEIAGGIRLGVPAGTAGRRVEVRLGEELQPDGRVRFHLRAGNIYREQWTLRDGAQALEHWGYRGFRWVELVTEPGLDLSGAVTGLALRIDWDDAEASFESSNPDLDRVWAMCKYSIAATRQDVYQDTPTRERGPYEGDAIINQLSEYYTQRSYALARYSNHFLAHRPTWPTEYRIMGPILAWEDYLATGDETALATDYAVFVDRNLDEFVNAAGLVEKNPGTSSQTNADLVDWPAQNRDGYVFTRVNTVINAWQVAAYASLARIAGALGRTADAADYAGRADRMWAAVQRDLYDPARGVFVDGVGTAHSAQHASAFPAALGGELEPAQRAALGEALAQGGMRVSVYGSQFLLDALYRCGRGDAALALMTSTGMSSWLHMIDDLGATIVAEAWDPSIKPNTTFSHAWGSAPANVVGRRLVGVEPLEPGARLLRVMPQPGDLTWFRADVPTVRGPVHVALQREGGWELRVVAPGNTEVDIVLVRAAVGLGAAEPVKVARRGGQPKPVEADGVLTIRTGGGETVVSRR